MPSVLDQLQLKHITLFCQDWGGLIGLRLVAANPVTAGGQKHTTLANGGHFLHEDQGEELAKRLVAFIHDNPR